MREQETKLLPERIIMRNCIGTLLNDEVKLKKTETAIDKWSRLSQGWGTMGTVKAGRETERLPFLPWRQMPGKPVRQPSQEARLVDRGAR